MAATSSVFEWIGAALANESTLKPMLARGAIRLALREGGLDPATVTASQMQVVLRRLLPDQLRRAGVDDADGICIRLVIGLNAQRFDQEERSTPTAHAFFQRVLDPRQ